jgi:NADH dehydrogenase FAD-containing subunit
MHAEHDVVIYGGGMAGAILGKQLSKDLKVALVDPRDFFEIPMAVPRNMVEPGFAELSTVPFTQALPEVTVVQGLLSEWTADGGIVKMADGLTRQLQGKVHVLATGSQFTNPMMRPATGSRTERLAFYLRYASRIAQSKRILIVGGGPIGVEMAGEISSRYPSIHITLLESGSRILMDTTEAASRHASAVLGQRQVEICTDDRLVNMPDTGPDMLMRGGEVVTQQGRRITYDMLLLCTGASPNTAYMNGHLASALDDHARIRVTPSLRVVGESALFALGDINNVAENKMAWHVAGQVSCTVKNVRRVLAGRVGEVDLVAYHAKTGNPAMAVTLGPEAGMVHLPPVGLITAGWINRRIKVLHMMVPKYRKILGV